MNTPGFTAQMSLYTTTAHYNQATVGGYASEHLYPAQFLVNPGGVIQGPPSFGGGLCWMPYRGWCFVDGRPIECWRRRYIC